MDKRQIGSAQIADAKLTLAALETLGASLKLSKGWSYRTRVLACLCLCGQFSDRAHFGGATAGAAACW